MNAAPHVFRSFDNEGNNIDYAIYPSRHVIGPMLSAGDVDSPNANIFEKAFDKIYDFDKLESFYSLLHTLVQNLSPRYCFE